MTQAEADARFGAAARELKLAETEHRQNIGKAMDMARDLRKLSEAMTARAHAAEMAGQFPQGNQDEPLSLTGIDAPYVDAAVLKDVDREISASVARVIEARRQHERYKP
jgi:hypothetical protein